MTRIPVMRPRLPEADAVLPYLRRMDQARIYSNFGPLADELEHRYAERFNVAPAQVVACANATVGLQGALEQCPVEVAHVPAWTFAATPMAAVQAHRAVRFHDVGEDWQLVDVPPSDDGALMPVLPFGAEIDLERWAGWQHCVIDAAASGGAARRDLSALPDGWSVVLSLHATKVLGAGEAGIVVFGNPDAAERFRSFTQLGFVNRRESDFRGTNGKLAESMAAYGLAALDGWGAEEAEWRAARELTLAAESALGLSTPCSSYPGVSPYWVVRFADAAARESAERMLDEGGVDTRRWWPTSCAQMPAFAEFGADCHAGAFDLADTTLGLPFRRDLLAADVDRVVECLSHLKEDR